MKHVKSMAKGYANFFKNTLPTIAISPYDETCSFLSDCTKPENDPTGAGALVSDYCVIVSTCMLTPVLLPLTALTSSFSLLLAIAAGVVSPVAFGVAAAQDCCDSSNDESMTPKPGRR